jgi:hypothetical protein
VGNIPDLVGVLIPIMSLPILFHGDMGGTREGYGPDLGKKSLSESPSFIMRRRRSLCVRLVERAG